MNFLNRNLAFCFWIGILLGSACFKGQKQEANNTVNASPQVEATAVDVSLARLKTNFAELDPEFSPSIFSYQLKGGETYTLRYNVNAVPSNTANTVKINGQKISSDFTSDVLKLEAGANELAITVHDSSDKVLSTYTINIQRAANLADGEITGLLVSTGTITPDFDPNIFEYSLTVPANYTVLTVSPEIPYPELTKLEINDGAAESYIGNYDINIVPGLNTIQFRLTGKSGRSNSYTLKVTRPGS
jgi:hypothetical protein